MNNIDFIQRRLDGYHAKTAIEEGHALREILRECILTALSMKKLIYSALSAMMAATVFAGIPAKWTWKLSADHADGLYKTGETAKFTLTGELDGKPLAKGTRFRASWSKGCARPVSKEVAFGDGSLTVAWPVEETCHYKVSLMPLDAEGKDVVKPWQAAQGGILANASEVKLAPGATPADFDAWWDKEVAAQKKIPMTVKMTPRGLFDGVSSARRKVIESREWEKRNFENTRNYDVRVRAAGENWLAGGLCIPNGPKDKGKKFPVVIHFYGVGWDGVCTCDRLGAVNDRCIWFHVNCHGLPDGATWEEGYPEMKKKILAVGASNPAYQKDYPKIGFDKSREEAYYRYVFLRAARAVDFVKTLPEWDGKTIIVKGSSQGGAQAVAAAALSEGATHVLLGIPAMCDFSGDRATPKRVCGWPFNVRGEAPRWPATGYYDVVSFAHRIHGKRIVLAYGTSDGLVQPCGPAALWNELPADNDKTCISEFQRGHDSPWCMGLHEKEIKRVVLGK